MSKNDGNNMHDLFKNTLAEGRVAASSNTYGNNIKASLTTRSSSSSSPRSEHHHDRDSNTDPPKVVTSCTSIGENDDEGKPSARPFVAAEALPSERTIKQVQSSSEVHASWPSLIKKESDDSDVDRDGSCSSSIRRCRRRRHHGLDGYFDAAALRTTATTATTTERSRRFDRLFNATMVRPCRRRRHRHRMPESVKVLLKAVTMLIFMTLSIDINTPSMVAVPVDALTNVYMISTSAHDTYRKHLPKQFFELYKVRRYTPFHGSIVSIPLFISDTRTKFASTSSLALGASHDDDDGNLLVPSYLPGEEEPMSIKAHHKHAWEILFLELQDYKKQINGSTCPPIGTKIGNWAHRQRTSHRKGQLSKYRSRRLNEIGFDWVATSKIGISQDELLVPSYLPGEEEPPSVAPRHKHAWEVKFLQLQEYKNQNNGSTSPPKGTTIGNWAQYQRVSHNKGQLSKYRTRRLNETGFEWVVSSNGGIPKEELLVPSYLPGEEEPPSVAARHKHLWELRFLELQEYKKQNSGSTIPPVGTTLGNWARTQRVSHNKGQLSAYRIRRLNEVEFAWEVPKSYTHLPWRVMYKRLEGYKEKNGDTNVPLYFADCPNLRSWCYAQNCNYWAGTLKPKRASLLDAIGFEWKEPVTDDDRWIEKYARLIGYKDKFGDTNVPQGYEEDQGLGRWVIDQRQDYRKGDMSDDRIQKLEDIGFVWNQLEAAWIEMYNKLIEYKDKFGNTDVSKHNKKYPKLGRWVKDQRQHYRKGDMSDDRIHRLEEIDFNWKVR